MSAKKLYVIGNSHMDPIWLWRLREGRSTWINTCRSVVAMMKKYPMLNFARSSSVGYDWIERADPALFSEIRKLVDAGRWELVGGWVEQSDTIITPGESLIRQAEHGKRYFKEKFGRDIRIAYSVDSFGQNCAMPKLLNATGFDRYAWMRPMGHEKKMPNIFRWKGDDGRSEVLSFRILQAYCTPPHCLDTEEKVRSWLDGLVRDGEKHQSFFFGVGDHGGGFYENQLKMLLAVAGDYDLEFTTLEHYFDIIDREKLPTVEGEHVHHAPGCYAAVSDVKRWMSTAEKNLYKAEKIVLESRDDRSAETAKLQDAWNELLFNYFHDVYPGTSIKQAYDHEIRNIAGYADKIAVDILEMGLCRYACQARTDFLTEGGFLAWNPLPQPVTALVSFEACSDPVNVGHAFTHAVDADGKSVPVQWVRSHSGARGEGRVMATVKLPPSGMRVFAFVRDGAETAALGFKRQRDLLPSISFDVVADPYDTWAHGAQALGETLGFACLKKVEELEDGPVMSRLRVHYYWKNSNFHLDLITYAGIDEVELVVSGDWRETDKDLKLCFKTGFASGVIASGQAGAVLERTPDPCEQPFIDWFAAVADGKAVGFLAGALHSYDSAGTDKLRLTLLRPVHYAEHEPMAAHGDEGYADVGEFTSQAWLVSASGDYREVLPRKARERLWHAEHLEITNGSDGKHFKRDEWAVEPAAVTVMAQRRNADGASEFHLENPLASEVECRIKLNGKAVWSGKLAPAELKLLTI